MSWFTHAVLLSPLILGVTGAARAEPPVAPAPRAVLDSAELVHQLGSPEFAEREAAGKKLRALGTAAEPALRAGLKSDDPEVRQRAGRLLETVRKDSLDVLLKAANPATPAEPDHPVWRRFKSVAGNDAAARAMFAELAADPRRLKLLDDAERNPDAAGELYAAAVKAFYATVEKLWDRQRADFKVKHPDLPWADGFVVVYLGTYPKSRGAFPATNIEVHALRAMPECFKEPAGPAMRRVFAAWLAVRDNPDAVDWALTRVATDRTAGAIPLLRTMLADGKTPPDDRARAALLLGLMGEPADLVLLRRVAESGAAQKTDTVRVIVKGQEHLSRLWNAQRFGGTVTAEEQAEAMKQVEMRDGTRTLADCAWAAAVRLAGGKPADLGFLWPLAIVNGKINDDTLPYPRSHGFPDEAARTAAHAKAKAWLDARK